MSDPNRTVRLGSRVYYKDKGPSDVGTVVNITLEDYPFTVKWDRSYNPDETLDQFCGNQLAFADEDDS